MIRRLTLALTAGALVAATVPGIASAGGPIGGCPAGEWRIVYDEDFTPIFFAGGRKHSQELLGEGIWCDALG